MRPKVFFFLLFLLGLLFLATPASVEAYYDCCPAGPGPCGDLGYCIDNAVACCYPSECNSSEDWTETDISNCQENLGSPNNYCCRQSSCGGTECGTIDYWDWCHASSCQAKPHETIGKCVYRYRYTYDRCGAVDSCITKPYLEAGECSSGGCTVGGDYKTCCSGTTVRDCEGGQFTGTCPAGSVARFCGFGGNPPCGPAACAAGGTPTPGGPTPTPGGPQPCLYPYWCANPDQCVFPSSVVSGYTCGVPGDVCCQSPQVPTPPGPSATIEGRVKEVTGRAVNGNYCTNISQAPNMGQKDVHLRGIVWNWQNEWEQTYETTTNDDYFFPYMKVGQYASVDFAQQPGDQFPNQNWWWEGGWERVYCGKNPEDANFVQGSNGYTPQHDGDIYEVFLGFYRTTLTCTVSLSPDPLTIQEGGTSPLVATVSVQSGQVSQVDFSSSETRYARVNPSSDTTPSYSTTVSGVSRGSATLTARVYDAGGVSRCEDTSQVTVTSPGPWFQTQGGDVHGQGDISSQIPSTATNTNFSRDIDSYPGVVSYLSGTIPSFGAGTVSSTGWLANSSFLPAKASYNYFYQKLDSPTNVFDCSSPTTSNGFYRVEGNCTLSGGSALNFGNNKVVVFVTGNLVIERNIEVGSNGFIGFIVQGNIETSPTIGNNPASANRDNPNIQGLYLAGGEFRTNQGDTPAHARLVGKGIFKAQSFSLGRDLGSGANGNGTYSAELFLFDPALVLNAPRELWYSKMSWLEVAP